MEDSARSVEPSKDVLCADIADLGLHIADVVSEAIGTFRAKAITATEASMYFDHIIIRRFSAHNELIFWVGEKEFQVARSNIEHLDGQLSGYKRENHFLRKQLVGLLQSHNQSLESQARQEFGNDSSKNPGFVPYTDYERLTQKLNALQQQLLQSNEQHKTEATARRLLISKMRDAKKTAREWMEYHRRYEEKMKKLLAKNRRQPFPVETPLSAGADHSRTAATGSPLAGPEPDPPTPEFDPLNDIMHSPGRLLAADDHTTAQDAPEFARLESKILPLLKQVHTGHENDELLGYNAQHLANGPVRTAAPISRSQEETMMETQPGEVNPEKGSKRVADHGVDNWIHAESSDDHPVIVKARGSKRRRLNRSPQNYVTPTGGGVQILVKEEPSSDNVVSTASVLKRIETVDLDEVGSKIETPRKRQLREREELLHFAAETPIRVSLISGHERSLSEPLLDAHEAGFGDVKDANGLDASRLGDSSMAAARSMIERPTLQDRRPGGETLRLSMHAGTRPGEAASPLSTEDPGLSPVDVNSRLLSTTHSTDRKGRKIRSDRQSRGADFIHFLSEDGTGNENDEAATSLILGLNETPSRTISSGRLNVLLEQGPTLLKVQIPDANPSPGLRAWPDSTTTRVTPRGKKKPPEFKIPELPKSMQRGLQSSTHTAEVAETESTYQTRKSVRPKVQTPLFRPAEPLKPNVPCRDRPPASLHKDDFRLNPNHNFGLDYAFSEPLRGRAARQCAPGCTDDRCCGVAMRALAAELRPTLSRSFYPNSPEDRDLTDDEFLLKHHLGNRWDRENVASMPAVAREELLLQARTKLVAERYGRHKVTSERRKSPPGFWRTEMPSTPEMEQDRQAAEEMDRETVQQRYEEAMRGGRWKFRDE